MFWCRATADNLGIPGNHRAWRVRHSQLEPKQTQEKLGLKDSGETQKLSRGPTEGVALMGGWVWRVSRNTEHRRGEEGVHVLLVCYVGGFLYVCEVYDYYTFYTPWTTR